MKVTLKQPNQPVADFSISGTVVTVSGVSIDTSARQDDVLVTVEIRANVDGPSEGGDGAYLAQIDIPARRYITQHVPSENTDEEATETREPAEFDPNAVMVTLWPTTFNQ